MPNDPSALPSLPSFDDTRAVSRSQPIDHWDALFDAVTTTLTLAATKPAPNAGLSEWPARETMVMECVHQLELLHEALRDERRRFDESRRMVEVLQEALALARTELLRLPVEEVSDSGPVPSHGGDLFRSHLDKTLAIARRQKQAVAVLQLDLEGCQAIEDRHGKEIVEDVLSIVEKRLSGTIRPTDTLARVGHEQFACVLVDVPGREQLSHLACKLLDVVAEPLQVRALQLAVRPSIGIATWHEGALTADELSGAADEAMVRARHDGSGYAFSDEHARAWAQWSESTLGNSVS